MPPLWFINRGWLWPRRICNNACIYIYSIHSHTLYFQLPPLPLCLNVHKPIANETWPAGSHQCERVSIFLLSPANGRNAGTRHIWRMWIHVCNWGCLTKVQRFDNDEAAPFGARNSWWRDQRVAWFTVEDEGGVSTLGYHLCTGYVSLFRYLLVFDGTCTVHTSELVPYRTCSYTWKYKIVWLRAEQWAFGSMYSISIGLVADGRDTKRCFCEAWCLTRDFRSSEVVRGRRDRVFSLLTGLKIWPLLSSSAVKQILQHCSRVSIFSISDSDSGNVTGILARKVKSAASPPAWCAS